jgi:hypothetical protein
MYNRVIKMDINIFNLVELIITLFSLYFQKFIKPINGINDNNIVTFSFSEIFQSQSISSNFVFSEIFKPSLI